MRFHQLFTFLKAYDYLKVFPLCLSFHVFIVEACISPNSSVCADKMSHSTRFFKLHWMDNDTQHPNQSTSSSTVCLLKCCLYEMLSSVSSLRKQASIRFTFLLSISFSFQVLLAFQLRIVKCCHHLYYLSNSLFHCISRSTGFLHALQLLSFSQTNLWLQ